MGKIEKYSGGAREGLEHFPSKLDYKMTVTALRDSRIFLFQLFREHQSAEIKVSDSHLLFEKSIGRNDYCVLITQVIFEAFQGKQ